MPRIARIVVPHMAVHIVQRGHSRMPCFFRPGDYRNYLRYLRLFAARHGCAVHAYCLMTNHVHLLLTPTCAEACALLMKHVGQCYVQTVNKALGRSGSLWEGRFRSCLVPSERYALGCYRYIELNPVRAGMVRHPSEYPWSSFRENVEGDCASALTAHPAYEGLSMDPLQRRLAYRSLCDQPLEERLVDEIRRATRAGTRLGDPPKRRGRPKSKTGTDPISAETGSVPLFEIALSGTCAAPDAPTEMGSVPIFEG